MKKIVALSLLLGCLFMGLSVALAQTEVHQGTVTRSPWTDGYTRIEIDHKLYTFMPEAVLYRRTPDTSGGYDEEAISYYNVITGKQVEFQAQGRRIYSLVVLR